ncbi:NfeD family protein [Tyzzerella sp. OttesenSCG-928-J15]|nr:NfeD family protein [Tyzzerella sp. OttesenSCG-928-J15]
MLLLFKVCFGVGVGYAVISFLLGEVLEFAGFGGIDGGADVDLDLDLDIDLDFDIDTDVDFSTAGGGTVTPLKPACIGTFISVFGGMGIILLPHMGGLLAAMVAATLGLIAAYIIYRFVVVPLHKAQNTSAVEKQSLIGSRAMVSEKIPQGQFGKITYYVNGNTYSAPAKSEDGNEIARNSDVEIVHIEKNTYYVAPKAK